MDLTIIIFLLGGLFLGWSLGANDAANVFGTAVGTRMVRFKTAALVCSVFVIFGAIISGAGTTETLGKLGSINALPGAFAACVAAGLSVYLMTKLGLPVSTTQAIVGAIVGWNIYTGSSTNIKILFTILSTWVLCPIIAALVAMLFFILIKQVLKKVTGIFFALTPTHVQRCCLRELLAHTVWGQIISPMSWVFLFQSLHLRIFTL